MANEIRHDNHNGHILPLEDTILYYEVRGVSTGIPLFVLHGGPGFDHSYLEVSPIWDDFGTHRPVILYDQRGTGRSSPLTPEGSCTLVDQIADLYTLQQYLGFEQIDLLGHSWGGFLAMAYAIHHPQNVRKLIIVDSAAPKLGDTVFLFEPVFPETMERKNALAFRVESGDREAMSEDLRAYLSMLCYSRQKRDEFLSAADGFIYRSEVQSILWADAEKFDLGPELTKLSQQTLVISGRYDMNVAPSVAYKIHQAISGSQFAVFEQSGHLPFFEETALFQEKVNSFLD